MANDFGKAGTAASSNNLPAKRSGVGGRSPVATPQGGNVTAVAGIQHSAGTRNSNRGAH